MSKDRNTEDILTNKTKWIWTNGTSMILLGVCDTGCRSCSLFYDAINGKNSAMWPAVSFRYKLCVIPVEWSKWRKLPRGMLSFAKWLEAWSLQCPIVWVAETSVFNAALAACVAPPGTLMPMTKHRSPSCFLPHENGHLRYFQSQIYKCGGPYFLYLSLTAV